MPTISAWSGAPRFDADLAKAERESLSFAEISAALEDVNGTSSPDVVSSSGGLAPKRLRRDVGRSEEDLERLESSLKGSIPESDKAAWMQAQERCPGQVGRDHLMRFLRSADRSADIPAIAEKVCMYWKKRLDTFGEGRAFLPMTMDGALRDDHEALEYTDFTHYLPGVEDAHGRVLLHLDESRLRPRTDDRKSVFRAVWYMWEAALQGSREPANGAILVANLNVDMDHLDRKLMKDIFEFYTYFPLDLKAIHIVARRCPWWFHNIIFPVALLLMGPKLRLRHHLHFGTREDILASLETFGIGESIVPVQLGGCFKFHLKAWLKQRRMDGL